MLGVTLMAFAVGLAHGDMPAGRNISEMKFRSLPQLPACLSGSIERGDPRKSGFIAVMRAETGCEVPWHWHSSGESLMIVEGTAFVAMRGEGATAVTLKAGGFATLPPKHVHQFRCQEACTFFLLSDGKLDIHYVDPSGKEIPPKQALGQR